MAYVIRGYILFWPAVIHYSFYNPNDYGRKSNEANIIIFKVGLS